jgi:hypothetical protein
MKQTRYIMKPQDIVILLKIIANGNASWQQIPLAQSLRMSQSEISQSINRSKYAGLLDDSGRQVMRLALLDFLQYGIAYVFPQKPGPVTRGIPTAHSAPPLNSEIESNDIYVWPSATGKVRGQSILPLYPSVVEAIKNNEILYELLALVDAIRVGRVREKNIAIKELKIRIINHQSP